MRGGIAIPITQLTQGEKYALHQLITGNVPHDVVEDGPTLISEKSLAKTPRPTWVYSQMRGKVVIHIDPLSDPIQIEEVYQLLFNEFFRMLGGNGVGVDMATGVVDFFESYRPSHRFAEAMYVPGEDRGKYLIESRYKNVTASSLDKGLWSINDDGTYNQYDLYGVRKYPLLSQFQNDAVKTFFSLRYRRQLLAWAPGSGKTLAAIAIADCARGKALVVAPAYKRIDWYDEIKEVGANAFVFGKKGDFDTWKQSSDGFLVISYTQLHRLADTIPANTDGSWIAETMILDEAHAVANPKSRQSRATEYVSRAIPNVVALTGTPFLNRPIELFSLLKILRPDKYSNRLSFARRYCDAQLGSLGWDFSGASNLTELHQLLKNSHIVSFVSEKDAAQYLPDVKEFPPIRIPLSTKGYETYRDLEARKIQEFTTISGAIKPSSTAVITDLRQVATAEKATQGLAWLESFLASTDQSQGVLVFCEHKETVDRVQNNLRLACRGPVNVITGDVNFATRSSILDQFNSSSVPGVLVATTASLGTGLNIQGAQHVVFFEEGWSFGARKQAIARAARRGQSADTVFVWTLLAAQTIEEVIHKVTSTRETTFNEFASGTAQPIQQPTTDEIADEIVLSVLRAHSQQVSV